MKFTDFRRSIDLNKLVQVRTFTQVNVKNNVRGRPSYCFECLTKTNEVLVSQGSSWGEVYKKLPDEIKKVVKEDVGSYAI